MPNFSRPTNCRLDVTFTVRPFCLWGNNSRLSFGRTLGGFQSQSTCGDSKFLALQCVVSLLLLLFSSSSSFSYISLTSYCSCIYAMSAFFSYTSVSCPLSSPTHVTFSSSTFLSLHIPSSYLSSHSLFIFSFICSEVK